jgi:phosphatidylserine/phosphatidylglycerophosphate/cardiolipin synthase-like enzyme
VASSLSVQVLRSRFPYKVRFPPTRWTFPPHAGIHEVFRTQVQAIRGAERYIYAEDQFLGDNVFRKPEFSLFPHLRDAAARGVKLILVTSGKSDPRDPRSADINFGLNRDLERYLVNRLPPERRTNLAVFRVAHLTVHAKVLLIDDRYAAIGTANLQSRSMDRQDFEIHAALVDPGDWVRRLRAVLWGEHLRLAAFEPARADLEDLDLALGIWRPEWLPDGVPADTWRVPGRPAGYRPREVVLSLVGPPPAEPPARSAAQTVNVSASSSSTDASSRPERRSTWNE